MKRLTILFALGAALAACNKPTPEACKKAMLNMEHILGTDNLNKTGDIDGEVRRCRGGSSKESVECASAAQTKDDLIKCEFYKPPVKAAGSSDDSEKPAPGSASGSGAGSDQK